MVFIDSKARPSFNRQPAIGNRQCFQSAMGSLKLVCRYLILIAAISASTLAQQNNSGLTIEGVVLDSAGAPIVEAQVQIANSRGLVAATTTRSDGSFRLL